MIYLELILESSLVGNKWNYIIFARQLLISNYDNFRLLHNVGMYVDTNDNISMYYYCVGIPLF